eukprot:g73346.t1
MDEVRQQLRLEANTSTSLCVCNSPELRSGIQLCASVTIRNNKEDIDESATSTRIAALAFKCRQCKKNNTTMSTTNQSRLVCSNLKFL